MELPENVHLPCSLPFCLSFCLSSENSGFLGSWPESNRELHEEENSILKQSQKDKQLVLQALPHPICWSSLSWTPRLSWLHWGGFLPVTLLPLSLCTLLSRSSRSPVPSASSASFPTQRPKIPSTPWTRSPSPRWLQSWGTQTCTAALTVASTVPSHHCRLMSPSSSSLPLTPRPGGLWKRGCPGSWRTAAVVEEAATVQTVGSACQIPAYVLARSPAGSCRWGATPGTRRTVALAWCRTLGDSLSMLRVTQLRAMWVPWDLRSLQKKTQGQGPSRATWNRRSVQRRRQPRQAAWKKSLPQQSALTPSSGRAWILKQAGLYQPWPRAMCNRTPLKWLLLLRRPLQDSGTDQLRTGHFWDWPAVATSAHRTGALLMILHLWIVCRPQAVSWAVLTQTWSPCR